MKVIIKVGKSEREVDLQHLIEAARTDEGTTSREAIEGEITALFVGALSAEWLRISDELKSLKFVRDWVHQS